MSRFIEYLDSCPPSTMKDALRAAYEAIDDSFSVDSDAVEDLARDIIRSYISDLSNDWTAATSQMRMYHKYIANAYAEYQGHPIQFRLMVDPFTSVSRYAGGVDRAGTTMEILTFGNPQRLTDIMVDVCQGKEPEKIPVIVHLQNFLSNGPGWRILTHELTHMAQKATRGIDSYDTSVQWIERKEEQEALLADIRHFVKFGVSCNSSLEHIMQQVDRKLASARKHSAGHDVEGLADYVHSYASDLYGKLTSPFTDETFDRAVSRMNTMKSMAEVGDIFYRDDPEGLRRATVEGIVEDIAKAIPLSRENRERAREYAARKADKFIAERFPG